jgi:hypothetical protein
LCIVDEKQLGLRIIRQIALRDVLPVASKIDEADGLVVEDAQEAGRPAAVLDVGLPLAIDGGKKDARLRPMNSARSGVMPVCQAPRSSMRA